MYNQPVKQEKRSSGGYLARIPRKLLNQEGDNKNE